MRTKSLLQLSFLLAAPLFLQPALAQAGQPVVLTADQMDGIFAGLAVEVDATAEATGDSTSTKTLTKTKVTEVGNKVVGQGLAIAIAKGSDCASAPASCSADTSGSITDGVGKVRTFTRTLKNGTKISVTVVIARGSA